MDDKTEVEKQYQELSEAVRPFLEAYKLHQHDSPLSKRKNNMALSLSLSDWERLVEVTSAHERDKSV